jgi:hypothetical protein
VTRDESELDAKELSRRRALRELLIALCVALAGGIGALPLESTHAAQGAPSADPIALLVWIALIAPAAGCACAALGLRPWPYAAVVPGAWMSLVALVGAFSERTLPTPLWGSFAFSGLFFFGGAIGALWARRVASSAGLVLLATALAIVAPCRGSYADTPWPAKAASVLLDLSPATLVAECSGLDWMRHPSIYGPVGTDRFEREPWNGPWAGSIVLGLGCAAWLAAARVRDRRSRG